MAMQGDFMETSDRSVPRIGFIGLGTMGRRLATRLLAGGCSLSVYDRAPEATARLMRAAQETPSANPEAVLLSAETADAIIAASEIVFTSLPAPEDVRGLYLHSNGVAPSVHSEQVLVDLSTIDPTTCRAIAAAVAARGAAFLDAPVSGGIRGAETGTLTIMAGGEAPALERVQSLLAMLSERVVHVGPSGTGAAVKLANQLLVASHTIAAAEALAFASRFGVDRSLLVDVLSASAGDSRMVRRTIGEFARTRDFSPAFALRLLAKDLRLYAAEAEAAGVPAPSGGEALKTFEMALAAGLGDEDFAAVLKLIE